MNFIKLFFCILLLSSMAVSADCLQNNIGTVYCGYGQCQKNNIGQVFCSKFKDGGAQVTNIGQVKCGKGKCINNNIGQVYCSATEGGGAAQNNIGQVKCYGGCEEGQESMCESVEGT